MTLVAYKAGVMAADTSCWQGDVMVHERDKAIRLPNGLLLGCCGDCAIIDAFTDWAERGFPAGADIPAGESPEDFEAIVIAPDGTINRYDHKFRREIVKGEWIAIGCGTSFANGLFVAGWSAKKVVEEAIKRVAYVGGRCTTVRLGPVQEVIEEGEVAPTWREERGLA